MSGKELLAAKFIGNVGTVDGTLETGIVKNCGGDSWDYAISGGATAASFLGSFPKSIFGIGGGATASILTTINVGRNKKITASDVFTILGGIAGALAAFPAFAGMAAAAAVFTVGGFAVTLYDMKYHKDADGCVSPPYIPLGDLVPPSGGDGNDGNSPNQNSAASAPLSCPLIIDMDKNGVKTISIHKNTFFDLDNNLFAENTGWIDKGDAFLVWDRNLNGIIDSGSELFGNNTLLKNGQKADNGFLALSELDSNNDNIIDQHDSAWLALQLWFDHNQNGISEEGELVKLSESGLKNINLAFSNIEYIDEAENVHRQRSNVTWNDGSISEITDVWFKINPAISYNKETIKISKQAKEMPNVIGFGNLLNLHEAMTKNTNLIYVVQEYIESSYEDRKFLLDHLIYEWVGVSKISETSRGNYIDARKLHTIEILTGIDFKQQGRNPNPNRSASELLDKEFRKFANYVKAQIESKTIYKDIFNITSFNVNSSGELEFDWSHLNNKLEELVNTNEILEAKNILSIYKDIGTYNQDYQSEVTRNLSNLSRQLPSLSYIINSTLPDGTYNKDIISGQNHDEIISGLGGDDEIHAKDGRDILIGGLGNDHLDGGTGSDTYLFSKGHGQDIIEDYDYQTNTDQIIFTDVNYNEVKFRREKDDLILFGYHEGDSVRLTDFYYNQHYEIEQFVFADRTLDLATLRQEGIPLFGTEGDDEIRDWDGKARIDAGAGDDKIYAKAGEDTLIGGTGNDLLNGGANSDTYLFSKGHGQDTIEDYDYLTNTDQVVFADVNYDEVKFRREKDDLILFGYHENDSLRLTDFYYNQHYEIEQFVFADRTLDLATLRQEGIPLFGTEGDDEIHDWDGKARIDAGAGDDRIYAKDGEDTLIGGTGNDLLNGGANSDTYLFSKGHGHDTIKDYDYQTNTDQVVFTDVNYNEVKFRREKDDLILFGYHENDSLRLTDFYYNWHYEIEQFVFADRTLDLATLRQEGITLFGTDGDDEIHDWDGKARIDAGAGDDRIYAKAGEDTLIGGTGNDLLNGGANSDTYLFSKGHGHDTIKDYDYQTNTDQVVFTDVNYNEVKFRREKDDLILFGYHENDSLRLTDFYYNQHYEIERFVFADRELDVATLRQEGIPLFGTDGNDEIHDWDGKARIDAGAGDDKIYAKAGEDTLIGGTGNDLLNGGANSDTYLFSKGHGQDTIEDYDYLTNTDQVVFADVNYDEVKFRREKDDLILFGYHEGDSVRLTDFYYNQHYEIEQFVFADRTVDLATLRQEGIPLFGTEGDDEIRDWKWNARINGGAGNDLLNGGEGSDTYIFSKGHGQDIIKDYDTQANIDQLLFTDVNYHEVKFRREKDDLILFGYHENDSLRLTDFYYNQHYEIERFVFADRELDVATLRQEGIPLFGTDGNDEIHDWDGKARIDAGAGDDRIYAKDGEDTLIGGTGNDLLNGGANSDTYLFSKGHGHDTIKDYDYQTNTDQVVFTDVNYNEVKFRREKDDLILFGYHENDSLRLTDFYYNQHYEIEQFVFADRTLDLATLRQEGIPLFGTEGDDEIHDWDGKARIDAGAGDDRIYAKDGEDTLIGGTGNDLLNGGANSDTYLFSKGHGHDTIKDYDYQTNTDQVVFTDVNYNEVKFRREKDDLILFGYHENDSLRLTDFYYNWHYEIERFVFADRELDVATLRQEGIPLFGTDGNDEIHDWDGKARIGAGAGDDRIYAKDGEDTLIGGTGNDLLNGGANSDTYLFSKGHGHDTIKDYDYQTNTDQVVFTDVNYDEVKFRREKDDLILFGYHENDSLRLTDFYYNQHYEIEQFVFADRTVDLATLRQEGIPLFGTDENDDIRDWNSNSQINAGSGDDKIYTRDGDDVLIGGTGNDILEGGSGSDTYIFRNGDGQDTIEDYSYNSNEIDTIQFADIDSPEKLWFSKKGSNLQITNLETSDSVTINKWYSHNYYQIERIALNNNNAITSAQVDKLVSAMATFEAQHTGDILSASRDDIQQHMNAISVTNYYS